MFLIWILAYIAVASIAMFWTVRWDNKLDYHNRLDDGGMYALIAGLWPIAFPIWTAYVMAHTAKEEEE